MSIAISCADADDGKASFLKGGVVEIAPPISYM
jgi:hypothetical protein